MLHDEAIYGADTDQFIPERFLNPDMKDPTTAFGFGRRQGFVTFDIQVSERIGKILRGSTFRAKFYIYSCSFDLERI
jgi:hypothetical protein